MPQRLDRPTASSLGAVAMGRFLTGLAKRFDRRREQEREKDILAQRGEQDQGLLRSRQQYDEGVRADERVYEGEVREQDITRQDELLDRKEAEAIEAERVAQENRIEIQRLKNSILGINKPPKPPKPKTEPQLMRDFATVYGDILDKEDIRGIVKEKMKFGLSDTQAIGRYKGRYLAGDVLDDMQDSFFQWGKKPTDKFIRGDDLLMALSPNGLGGEIVGLDPNGMYSAEEAIILITSAQEDPVSFAEDHASMKNVMEVIHDLLEQSYDPGEGEAPKVPKEQVGVGKAFTRAFGRSSRAGTIPRLP